MLTESPKGEERLIPQRLIAALYKHIGDKHDVNNYRPINVTSDDIRTFNRAMLPTLTQESDFIKFLSQTLVAVEQSKDENTLQSSDSIAMI